MACRLQRIVTLDCCPSFRDPNLGTANRRVADDTGEPCMIMALQMVALDYCCYMNALKGNKVEPSGRAAPRSNR